MLLRPGDKILTSAVGNPNASSRFLVASVTKSFVTAVGRDR
ncbi:MAG TPA: hypothetical protein VIL18_03100 [Longimicrobiales bacterium]